MPTAHPPGSGASAAALPNAAAMPNAAAPTAAPSVRTCKSSAAISRVRGLARVATGEQPVAERASQRIGHGDEDHGIEERVSDVDARPDQVLEQAGRAHRDASGDQDPP